jgi:hypothetical protein
VNGTAVAPAQTVITWFEWDPALRGWVQKSGVLASPPTAAPATGWSWRGLLRW